MGFSWQNRGGTLSASWDQMAASSLTYMLLPSTRLFPLPPPGPQRGGGALAAADAGVAAAGGGLRRRGRPAAGPPHRGGGRAAHVRRHARVVHGGAGLPG